MGIEGRAQTISSSADASGSATPSASYSVALTLGSVDAVSGAINLSVPLGPVLPGRIPAGFRWTYDSMDPMQSRVGGTYLPVVWPSAVSGNTSRARVLGAKYDFLRAPAPTAGLPSDATMQSWMTSRGVDLGAAEAVAYLTANGGDGTQPPVYEIIAKQPSSDGTKWYIQSDWIVKIPSHRLDGTYLTYKVAKRMVILDGAMAIWSRDGRSAEFTNRYGDQVSLLVATDTANLQTTYTLRDQANPGQAITLVLKQGSGWSPFGSWDFQVQESANSTLSVTNTFGLPNLKLDGLARVGWPFLSPTPGLNGASSFGEWGFTPNTLTQTANNGEAATTSWNWTTLTFQDSKCQDPLDPTTYTLCALPSPSVWLRTITFPNGLTESFSMGEGVNLSSGAFAMNVWGGYHVGIPSTTILTEPTAPNPTQATAVWRVSRTGSGPGETILIMRKTPTITQAGGGAPFVWVQKAHETYVLKYPSSSPDATSKFRGVRLVHPSASDSIRQNTTTPQAYLFATSAILAKETIHGVGGPSNLSPSPWANPPAFEPSSTSYVRDSITVFDGWDLRSWANPSGSLSAAQPLTATPLQIRTDTDNLPSRITLAGLPTMAGARDAWGPTRTDEYTLPWSGLSTVDPGQDSIWSEGVGLPSSGVHRTGTIQRDWNPTLLALQTSEEHKTLEMAGDAGTARYVANLDPASLAVSLSPQMSADFGTTHNTYPASGANLGLLTQVSGLRSGYTATETRDYGIAGPNGQILPLATTVTKTLMGPNGPVPVNLDDASVKAGTDYTYTPDNFHRLASQIDKTTGAGVTYDAFDSFGRVTQKTERPLGLVTTYAYDDWGRLQTETNAAGTAKAVTTTYGYDPLGRWTKKTVASAEGLVLSIFTELDAFARVRVVRTFKGDGTELSAQTFGYDEWGQKTAVSPVLKTGMTPYGNTTYTYDDRGQVVRTTDPKGRTLSQVPVDGRGLALYPAWAAKTVDGATLTGIWTTSLDDRGFTRSEVHDLLGQKIAVVDQDRHVSTYAYDQDGHLLQTNQGGQVRSYVHNSMGWLTQRVEPEEGLTSYPEIDPATGGPNFNLFGVPRTVQMKGVGSGVAASMTSILNHVNAPAQITATDGVLTSTRTYSYDGLQRVASLTDIQPNGTLKETYGYDEVSRLASKSISDGTQSFTVSQTLDSLGKVTSLTYPSGGGRAPQLAIIQSDSQGRPFQVVLDGSLRGGMTYDQLTGSSDTTTLTYGNGVTTRSTVDQGELVRTDYAALPTPGLFPTGSEANALVWTAGGLLTDRGPDHFDYDALQRLIHSNVTGIWGEVTEQWFAYDRWGNRVAEDWAYVPSASSSPSKPEEVLAYVANYDAGNRLASTVTALSPGSWRGGAGVGALDGTLQTGKQYDALGRLTSVYAVPNNQGLKASSWGYDPSGRVMSEAIEGVPWTYLLDGEGLRFKRMKADGTIQYTVYGFNREPLSTFEKKPAAVVSATAMTLSAASARGQGHGKARGRLAGMGDPVGATILAPAASALMVAGEAASFEGGSDYGTVFNWTFGDGTTATGPHPVKTYRVPGTYLVTLRVPTFPGHPPSTATRIYTVAVPKPVISSFTAAANTLAQGAGGTTLSWSVSGATSLSLDNGIGPVTGATSQAVNPDGTTTYTLSAANAGGTVTRSVTVSVVQPPAIVTFTATPGSIFQGDGSILAWTVNGATSLSLDNGIGAVSGLSRAVSPSGTTSYVLTATNTLNGVSVSRSATATVYVSPRPTVPSIDSFTADALDLAAGSGTTLRWNVSNSVGSVDVAITSLGTVPASGSQWVAPASTTTYTLTATNSLDATKSVSRDVTVTVVNLPVITLKANPGAINAGAASTLTWSVANGPASVTIDQGVGTVGMNGTLSVSPGATTTYTLTASNLAGTVTAAALVSVTQKPVISSFQAASSQISQGASTTLTWSVQGAASWTVNGVAVSGTSLLVSPATTTTYSLIASNAAGSDTRTATITVVAAETFLWKKSMVYGFGQFLAEEQADQGGPVYIQSDYVGSPSILSDATGRVIGRQKALPFGERYGQSGTKSIRRYTNHEDQEGSPIYMQARMYLPIYGKFAQVDPAYDQTKDDPETWNLYNYVTNNPVTHTDPDGREAAQAAMGGNWFWDAVDAYDAMVASHRMVAIRYTDANTGEQETITMTEAEYRAMGSPTKGDIISLPAGTSRPANNSAPSARTEKGDTKSIYSAQTSGIIASGFSLSGLNGQAFATAGGVFVKGADLASSNFVKANAKGNVSMYDMAGLPGAQFQASTVNMPKSESFASTKVAADFYNTASAYHSMFPSSEKLMVNSAIRNDGGLFGSHTNSHTGTKPAIDVAYQDGNGRNLSGHTAAGLADVNRARSLLSIGGRYGFTRTVTAIEGIGSFQVRQDHDNHIHLGE